MKAPPAGPSNPSKPGAPSDQEPEAITVTAWLVAEDQHWTALAAEFNVVGMGPSAQAALSNMDELLTDYLTLVMDEGGAPADARRPIPFRLKAKLEFLWLKERAEHVVRKILRGSRHRDDVLERVHRFAHHAPC
jgi:hypothetical protein